MEIVKTENVVSEVDVYKRALEMACEDIVASTMEKDEVKDLNLRPEFASVMAKALFDSAINVAREELGKVR